MKATIVAISLIAISGCTDPDSAKKVLAENGFSDVQITGFQLFTCSKDDTYHTGFIATTPSGNRVEGAVCGGFMKGSTIRFN